MSDPTKASRAELWRASGSHFSWSSTSEDADAVEVFHVELGDPDAPVLALVHGFPTSSIDWFEVAARLSSEFRVCLLDFPGYGFSDKPRGWGYNLRRDAELLDHYLGEVVGARSVVMVAHDRGDSVALLHAAAVREESGRVDLDHLVLCNGNMFLPLSNVTDAQRVMLHEPELLEALTPELLAAGLGAVTFSPPRAPEDPDVQALAATFAHADGVGVLHETVQYLVERSVDEETWLRALASNPVPTTIIWGLLDTVSPVRVATYMWHEYVMLKPGRNALYVIPGANHYLQNDRPEAFVQALTRALKADGSATPGALDDEAGAPVLIDRSRKALPAAAEIIGRRAPAPAPPPPGEDRPPSAQP